MLEDFLYAIQSFTRNKIRSFLSLLGIIIGVASVIIITSLGSSSTKKITSSFGSNGLDVVSITGGRITRGRSPSLLLDENFRSELFNNIPYIKKVWYKNNLSGTLFYKDLSSSINCAAIETDYLEIYKLELESGNFFNVTDNEEACQKIILNYETAKDFFPAGDALGKKILLLVDKVSFNFEVIGVLKEQSTGMENSAAYIPRGFYAKKIKPNPRADTILVQAISKEKAPVLIDLINKWCREKTGSDYAVKVSSMQAVLNQMKEVSKTMSLMLSAIAAISLLVGGIGIMNIMIVTVTERKQEIGIRKALGASPADIRQQFLIESSSISLVGGFFGLVFGIILSLCIEYIQKQDFVINAKACVIAFFFSVIVGIFFGLNPASRAAKLDPVIALSSE